MPKYERGNDKSYDFILRALRSNTNLRSAHRIVIQTAFPEGCFEVRIEFFDGDSFGRFEIDGIGCYVVVTLAQMCDLMVSAAKAQ